MRVLHVLNDLSGGGAERLVLELCLRAAPEFESSVATVAGFGPLEGAFRRAGVPLSSGGRPRHHPGLRALGSLAKAARKADVIHTHLFAGDAWGGLAAVLAGRPLVSTVHNIDRDESWEPYARRVVDLLPGRTIAVSEAVARASEGRSQRVIPNGIDLSRFAAPHVGGGGVLAIGRRVPQKGFDILLRALDDLPHLTVRIAGDGPDAPAHPQVRWLGPRDDVPALLAEADVLAVPSRWEGFGLVAVEAMAAGVPVVASAVDGLAEVVGDAGVLVPPGDAHALADGLRGVLTDHDHASELSRRGRLRAERYSVDAMVRAYEAVWREAASMR